MPDAKSSSNQAVTASMFFDGSRLTLARHLAGWRKSELAKAMGKSATSVSAWESGSKTPSAGNVAELALNLSVSPGFFAVRSDDVAALSSAPHFRSLRSTTQVARDQAFAYGRLAVDIAETLERHVELPKPDVPNYPVDIDGAPSGNPEAAARWLREHWGLGGGPLRHVVRLAENHGVLAVFSPEQAASVDAYSFDSRLRPVVIMNPTKNDYYRQRFDVAHELGHLVMHSDAEPGGRVVEEQANRFAAELLMPAEQIRESLPGSMSAAAWRSLGQLKEHWGVSIQALLFRARRLGRLSDVSYRNAMTTVSARGWRRAEPGLITTIEQPSLLPRALEILRADGITEDILIEQCRAPRELFRTIVSRTPQRPTVPEDESGPRQISGNVTSLLR
ncbi:MAG TPA: XRE family transcriptional regulator [Marmoricola sp.]|nr:XRE family transcriptional regulator [Marmoricola sp.]